MLNKLEDELEKFMARPNRNSTSLLLLHFVNMQTCNFNNNLYTYIHILLYYKKKIICRSRLKFAF